jgi:uncharacterized protein (DUF2249 family)
MDKQIITLDVREDIRNGREPFSKIMNTVGALHANEQLRIIAPFEPVPLFHIMRKQGFGYTAKSNSCGDWEVLFTRDSQAQSATNVNGQNNSSHRTLQSTLLEIDARGLEPPQPMVMILEALANISSGAELIARTDRRPMHLYGQLEARGFVGQTEEQSDGSFLTHIRAR